MKEKSHLVLFWWRFDILATLSFVKLSFQEWTQQVQDMLNTKKFGDIAFRDKDFKNAVDYYSKVIYSFVCSYSLNFLGVTRG